MSDWFILMHAFILKWCLQLSRSYSRQYLHVVTYLVHARPRLGEQRPGLDMLWYQLTSHPRDFCPAVKDLQRQLLVGLHTLV